VDVEDTPGVGVVTMAMERRRRVAAVDMVGRRAAEDTAPQLIEEDTALLHVDTEDEATVGRRRPATKETWDLTTVVTIGGPHLLAHTGPVRTGPGNNPLARHPPRATEIRPWPVFQEEATMRTANNLTSRVRNHRPHCQELTMALAASRLWRWMQDLEVPRKKRERLRSMGSGIVMLMLLGCWLCSKQERRQVPTAKTSKPIGSTLSECSTNQRVRGSYVPPRQAWNQGAGRNSPSVPSPLNVPSRPAELPSSRGSPAPQPAAGEYYEDVDPRFAEQPPGITRPRPPSIQATNAYEDTLDIPQGARSPAESDRSNFTSISQRGVNPLWRDPMPPPPLPPSAMYGGNVSPRRPVKRPTDVLTSNPDFELPSRGGGPARLGGSAYPGRM
jgi:hypothetical protein